MKRQAAILLILVLMLGVTAFAEAKTEAQDSDAMRKWQCILLLGEDSRSETQVERSDVNLILCMNASEGRAKLISIMRDTWVNFPDVNKSGKINAGTVYGGPELTVKTVNEYFGTNIEKYVLVDFKNVIEFVDLLGGVDIEITEAERRQINKNMEDKKITNASYEGETYIEKAGMIHMNGAMALGYVRDRHSTESGDFDRVVRQRNLAKAMVETAKKSSVSEIVQMAVSFMKNVKTNMSIAEIIALVPAALSLDLDGMEECTIPFDGTFNSGMMNGTWKIVPNFEKNREMLHEFIYGDAA